MKKLIIPFLLCLFITSTIFAQTHQKTYKKIDYIQVDNDYQEQFIKSSENDLKSAYSSLVDTTGLLSWHLYKVQYPGGEKSNYNFISIATAESLSFFEDHFSKTTGPKFSPSQTTISSDHYSLIKSELWKTEDDTISNGSSTKSRYMTMDYMNVAPGKGMDYLMLENEVAKPIHEQRISENKMAGWEVYSLILPSGKNYGYNYATGNYFDKLEHVEFGFTNEVIYRATGKNSNIPELFNTIYSTRDLVKVELWELIAHN